MTHGLCSPRVIYFSMHRVLVFSPNHKESLKIYKKNILTELIQKIIIPKNNYSLVHSFLQSPNKIFQHVIVMFHRVLDTFSNIYQNDCKTPQTEIHTNYSRESLLRCVHSCLIKYQFDGALLSGQYFSKKNLKKYGVGELIRLFFEHE